jgi:hypothetical protein
VGQVSHMKRLRPDVRKSLRLSWRRGLAALKGPIRKGTAFPHIRRQSRETFDEGPRLERKRPACNVGNRDGCASVRTRDPETKTRRKYLAEKAVASMLLRLEHDMRPGGVLLLGNTPDACVP